MCFVFEPEILPRYFPHSNWADAVEALTRQIQALCIMLSLRRSTLDERLDTEMLGTAGKRSGLCVTAAFNKLDTTIQRSAMSVLRGGHTTALMKDKLTSDQ